MALSYLLSLMSGCLIVFAYAPFDLWLIAPFCLFIAFRQFAKQCENAARSFKLGFVFGVGWFGAGISWVHVSIADFGGLPLIGSIGLMALLCGYLALYPAVAFWATSKWRVANLIPLVLACNWFILEHIRSWLLSGFPWLSIGYSQLHSPFSGWIPVIGETGTTFLLVLCVGCFAFWDLKRRSKAALSIAIVLGVSGYVLDTVYWTKPNKSYTVSMVQGNISQSLRWQPEQDVPTMQKYFDLSQQVWDSDIVVWPEAAVPKLEPLAQEYLVKLDETAALTETGLVTGIVNYNFENEQVFNNVIALGKRKVEDKRGHYRYFHNNRYAKYHLLPVGEVVPFESLLRPLAPIFDLPMSSFTRGQYVQENMLVNGAYIAPAICFEIAFPRQVRANLTNKSDFILTVSNDAWFGHSHGPAQHLQIAQMRAKEFGLPVIRSTNNGITAFVDHRGDISSQLPQFESGTLTDSLYSTVGSTPYRQLGDIPLWLCVVITLTTITKINRSNK